MNLGTILAFGYLALNKMDKSLYTQKNVCFCGEDR